eukprot:GSChrysophyteH1.ASY1.ANO1.2876.1 assembled CDS
MAAVANRGHISTSSKESKPDNIPDIIEERRRDTEGKVYSNRYLRGKLLGKGGFAKCFLGTSMQSKNQYALKIVSKDSLVKPRAKQKLQTEIKIHRTLNHTNVVRFERFFEDSRNAYMLLELCANNSMSDLMKRRKKLCDYEARFYLLQIISSLKYLHAHGVIHRDLKLGNLFIDHRMRVKVGDFGLATRLSHADERKKTVCGTPNYIAPEILEGKDGHSFEVDVWSTGVILYTVLVGKPPFESKDVKSTYKRIVANQYSFPDHTQVCEHAKNLVRHMLQARPEKRPSWNTVLEHSFFSRSSAYTPKTLPESALRDMPAGPTAMEMQQYAAEVSAHKWSNSESAGQKENKMPLMYSGSVNDENDPSHSASSRPDYAPLSNQTHGSMSGSISGNTTWGRSSLTTSAGISGDRLSGTASGAAIPRVSARSDGYSRKFEIYQDNKQSSLGTTSGSNSGKNMTSMPSFNRTGSSGMTDREATSTITSELSPRGATSSTATENFASVTTPSGQLIRNDPKKRLDTLETMHRMLNRSFQENDEVPMGAMGGDDHSCKLIARVWVVRYVDYTSKYGLGFLLNTGSAGVYFNDSTKIVLSSDGSIFQYIERRRKEGQLNSEHVSQTHLITAYPEALQKKVTLLKHFRNYLVDQQKLSAKFDANDADMPFLKKWVRTRHAILFRLSNRIVQVVFFDRSEVLLSSEARVVTYVNKQGMREDHSLEEVLHAGRTDIAKRLKYTKDIMYRLISVAK